MALGLGSTHDADILIPGSSENLRWGAGEWRKQADAASTLYTALDALDSAATWRGQAYERYLTRFQEQLRYWQHTSEQLGRAAGAMEAFAGALDWAKDEASRAIDMWDAAEAATIAAKADHDQYVREQRVGMGMRGAALDLPFVNPHSQMYLDAQQILDEARYILEVVGAQSAQTLRDATAVAPLLTDAQRAGAAQWAIAQVIGTVMLNAAVDTSTQIVNAAGISLKVLAENPDILLELIGGIGTVIGGGAIIVGGVSVTATGAGAVAGVPATVAGAGVIGAGGVLVSDATGRWMNEVAKEKVRGVDRGDGRDDYGHFVGSDNRPWTDKERLLLDQLGEKRNIDIIRDKVAAVVENVMNKSGDAQQIRYYDGLEKLPDGTYRAYEVKTGGAGPDPYQMNVDGKIMNDGEQGTAILDGKEIKISEVEYVFENQ